MQLTGKGRKGKVTNKTREKKCPAGRYCCKMEKCCGKSLPKAKGRSKKRQLEWKLLIDDEA